MIASVDGDSRAGLNLRNVDLPRHWHQGNASLFDSFTAEIPEIRFEDWLPIFEKASIWNGLDNEEALLQLACHLRGWALVEWNLILVKQRQTLSDAQQALRNMLEGGS